MEKVPVGTVFLLVLTFVVALQECVVLFDFASFAAAEETQWYRQWPFYLDDLDSARAAVPFAYNGSYVELVIGLGDGNLESLRALAEIVAQKDGYIVGQVSLQGETRGVTISVPTRRVSKFLKAVAKEDWVVYVEPNWKYFFDSAPNDPGWVYQWGPAKIEADVAWGTQKGDKSVLVAVVDTGIYYKHSDLAQNYVPLGYDWVNNDSDPADDHGHGTHCAGIIAATTNNSIGISGMAQVRIMAEKGLAYNGIGYADDLANAIVHAADQGARIISCSWGSGSDSQLLHDAVKYATNAGALVIAAAGNTGTNEKHYPAAYPEVIAVTATDEKDKAASFTTYGDWVDLAAPGTSIYSTFLMNTYLSMSGTSMACPHVAGVAALVWSQFPMMTNEQVRSQLMNTADDLGAPGFDVYFGFGRVNARKAVAVTVALVGCEVVDAPAESVYFPTVSPSDGASAETAYDVVAGGVVYGLCKSSQLQVFSSAEGLLLASGKLNASFVGDAAVVLLGGPCPQRAVRFYEDAGLTPLRFAANATHYMFVTQTGRVVAALSKLAANSGHEDMFLVEVFSDGTNFFLVMYGFTWRGTWASGVYFKDVILKNLNAYSEDAYVFHWVDKGKQDGVPQSREISLEYP